MFCSYCGSQLMDGARFCSNCGAPAAQPVLQAGQPAPQMGQPASRVSQPARAVSDSLPAGMSRTTDGKIRWSFASGKENYVATLDEAELVLYLEAPPKKKRSALGGLGMFVLDMVAIHDDDYLFMNDDLPSEMFKEAPRVPMDGKEYYRAPLELSYITKLKDDSAHGRLKVYGTGGWHTLVLTEQQRQFLKEYLVAHCGKLREVK